MGTCYLSEAASGCFLEVFRNWILVPEKEVEARWISELELPVGTKLADCTAADARGFGITAEIHATPEYEMTRAWAAAFSAAGFAGIRYFLRHDPGQTLAGVAYFGPAGPREGARAEAVTAKPIGNALIQEVGQRFGIQVLPSP